MLSSLNRRSAAWLLGICFLTSTSANAGALPERVEKAAQDRVAAGIHQTLVFGVVDGDNSEVVTFGTLDDGKAPDGDTVYEIGSITKTFTATLLAEAVLAGRVTLDTPVAQILPDFKIPSRGAKEITLGLLGTQHSGLPRVPSNLLPKDFGQSLRRLRCGEAEGVSCGIPTAARSRRRIRILQSRSSDCWATRWRSRSTQTGAPWPAKKFSSRSA